MNQSLKSRKHQMYRIAFNSKKCDKDIKNIRVKIQGEFMNWKRIRKRTHKLMTHVHLETKKNVPVEVAKTPNIQRLTERFLMPFFRTD